MNKEEQRRFGFFISSMIIIFIISVSFKSLIGVWTIPIYLVGFFGTERIYNSMEDKG